jgi:hypothetical protein
MLTAGIPSKAEKGKMIAALVGGTAGGLPMDQISAD